MEQPDGFMIQGEEDLLNLGFVKSLVEAIFYVKQKDNNILIMSLYVDDL